MLMPNPNEIAPDPPPEHAGGRGLRIFGWVVLGALIGAGMVAVFLAYGQPGLLLEQMNLRYCG